MGRIGRKIGGFFKKVWGGIKKAGVWVHKKIIKPVYQKVIKPVGKFAYEKVIKPVIGKGGKAIGTALGTAAGTVLGNPAAGAAIGGVVGGAAQKLVGGS